MKRWNKPKLHRKIWRRNTRGIANYDPFPDFNDVLFTALRFFWCVFENWLAGAVWLGIYFLYDHGYFCDLCEFLVFLCNALCEFRFLSCSYLHRWDFLRNRCIYYGLNKTLFIYITSLQIYFSAIPSDRALPQPAWLPLW